MSRLSPGKGESKVCEVCRKTPMERLCPSYPWVKVCQRCVFGADFMRSVPKVCQNFVGKVSFKGCIQAVPGIGNHLRF